MELGLFRFNDDLRRLANAQERMSEFLLGCEKHDILCDSFHLSSGYTSIGEKRYVFNWNRTKFPDPPGFVQKYLDSGVRLCANIKPCLLRDHPCFEEAASKGLLVRGPDGDPTMVQFWDELGAYLDFTNPSTVKWWKTGVSESLLKMGVAATWNDNNEFEIWNTEAQIHGFGEARRAAEAKTLQTLLMMRASWEAQREFAPAKRPFLITRSGTVGMHRYVQTWSGDNYTSWQTLQYNIKMGIGLALSGISKLGHDIGGFSGPAPDPELFLRWVRFGIFLPRFSIHSWNDDQSVNEPWMYPEITPFIRDIDQVPVSADTLSVRPFMALAPGLRADYPPDLLRLSGRRMLLSRKRRHAIGRKLAGRSGCGAWKACALGLFAGGLWMVRFLVWRLLPRRPGNPAARAVGSSTRSW